MQITAEQAAAIMCALARMNGYQILPETFQGGLGFRVRFANGFTLDYSLPPMAESHEDPYVWTLMAGEKVEGLR